MDDQVITIQMWLFRVLWCVMTAVILGSIAVLTFICFKRYKK
jgi:hypothetical protein